MNKSKNNSQMEETIPELEKSVSGLFLSGIISDRVKKSVLVSNKSIEVVTYTVDSDKRKFYVDDFDPETYLSLGEFVSIPVYVKPYRKKSGDISYMLKIQKDVVISPQGEHF